MKEQLVAWMPLLTQIAIELVLPAVAMLVAWAARKWFLAKKSTEERAKIVSIAEAAYWVVAQYARKNPGTKIDKIAKAIETAIAELKRPLTPAETETVVNTVKARHEQTRVGSATPKAA